MKVAEKTSVSCPTTSFCAAVDLKGNALTYHSGTWSPPENVTGPCLSSVSCTTATFCIAVDGGGNALTYS